MAAARHLIAAAAGLAAAALSGCTATVTGAPVAGEPRLDPPLVSVFNVERLLLSADEISEVTGAGSLEVKKRVRTMWDEGDSVADRDCLATWSPAQIAAYDGSGWTVVRAEILTADDDDRIDQTVTQAVVHFPDADAAQAFLSESAKSWSRCDGTTLTYTGAERETVWSFSDFANTDGTLTMTQTRRHGQAWACQRALTVRSNVAIDTMVCGGDVTDEAADVAAGIAERMPQL